MNSKGVFWRNERRATSITNFAGWASLRWWWCIDGQGDNDDDGDSIIMIMMISWLARWMQTGLNKNRLKLTGTENSQAANVCITAVEGHSSEVLGVILILFSTITIVNLLMMMTVRGGEETPNSTHKVTTERATITLISFRGLLQQRVRIQKGDQISRRCFLNPDFFRILEHISGASVIKMGRDVSWSR